MSIRAMTWVWDQPLPPNTKIVLLAIADHAHDDGTNAWPSAQRIAAMTGYTVRSVRRITHDMVTAGYLEIEHAGTGRTTSRYRIPMDPTPPLQDTEGGQSDPPQSSTEGGQSDPPGRTPTSTQGGHRRPPREDRSDIAYKDEPSSEPSTEPPTNPSTETVDAGEIVDDVIDTPDALVTTTRLPVPDDRDPSRNPHWSTLEDIFGYRPTGAEASHWGKLVSELRSRGASPTEMPLRAARLVAQWGAKALTPASLVKHWDRFGAHVGTATQGDEDRLRDNLDRAQRRASLDALTDPNLALEPSPPARDDNSPEAALAEAATRRREVLDAVAEYGESDPEREEQT